MKTLFLCALSLFSLPAFAWNTELHWNICEPSVASVGALLGSPSQGATSRSIYFFDTASFDLFQQGILIRERDGGDKDELTVKIKVPSDTVVSSDWQNLNGFKCEFDTHGSDIALDCSLTDNLDSSSSSLVLSKKQQKFLASFASVDPSLWSSVQRLGVLADIADSFASSAGTLDVESMAIGNNFFMELSERVPQDQADATFTAVNSVMSQKGIQLCPDQTSTQLQKLKVLRVL